MNASTANTPKPKRGRPPKRKGMPNVRIDDRLFHVHCLCSHDNLVLLPQRPLSAYNAFFRDCRNQILEEIEQGALVADYESIHKESLKQFKGSKGPARFQAIARTISRRWKSLSDEERAPYEKFAKQEMDVYKVKKAEFLKKQEKVSLEAERNKSPDQDLRSSVTEKPTIGSVFSGVPPTVALQQSNANLSYPSMYTLTGQQQLLERHRALLQLERIEELERTRMAFETQKQRSLLLALHHHSMLFSGIDFPIVAALMPMKASVASVAERLAQNPVLSSTESKPGAPTKQEN